jgi:hypothetical protein
MNEMSPHESREQPLNPRQIAFARHLALAIAGGDRDFTQAYAEAGYAPNRGNAARLAADPRIKSIAEAQCRDALERNGLKVEYLQAKALELLHTSPTEVHRVISRFLVAENHGDGENPIVRFRLRDDLSDEDRRMLDRATWPLTEFKIDKDGIVAIKVPDKKAIIEMLCKQLGVGKDESVNVAVSLEALIAQSMQPRDEQAKTVEATEKKRAAAIWA